ncbi:MAG: magnesium transporter [Prolixibacteraceae bacterium]|nr:magnesium transporter [Prolixibacteraceae bacterium]MBN2649986.1 magnesium transporter [Prolixibacteraceae bacterium]
MQIEITREYIDYLKGVIESGQTQELKEPLSEMHPADIADILEVLSMDEAKEIYLLLEGDMASDVLLEIPEDDRRRFLAELPSDIIARQYIEYMDTDDAADVIGELPDNKREEVIAFIDDQEHAGEITELLSYDEDSAGGIMAAELVAVNENWNVQKCLKEIGRQSEDIDEIYYVYVVDNDNKLKGVLSLKKLIQYPTQTNISNIYQKDVISSLIDADREEVAQKMEKYDLVALPVVDYSGHLKGRITIDDVVDIIREEAEKDYQMVSGITGDVEPSDTVFYITKARLPWLLIGLVGGILGAFVISGNEKALEHVPNMAYFIPLIGAMAGNVGVQSSSIVVQSIASGANDLQSMSRKLFKELGVALIVAFVLAGLILIFNLSFDIGGSGSSLAFTVSTSLFIVVIFASLFGTFIPLFLDKLKIDPALATGPFITTMNDIMGLLIYMLIGQFMF